MILQVIDSLTICSYGGRSRTKAATEPTELGRIGHHADTQQGDDNRRGSEQEPGRCDLYDGRGSTNAQTVCKNDPPSYRAREYPRQETGKAAPSLHRSVSR